MPNPPKLVTALGLAAVAGALYAFAQPTWGFWPLSLVCLVPLFWSWRRRTLGQRALLGWMAGTVATCLSTVVPAIVGSTAYFGLSVGWAIGVSLSVGQIFGAGSFALAAALSGDPDRGRPWMGSLRAVVSWVGAEYLRSTVLTGLPWLLFAHSLASVPGLIQLASLGGALLVSAGLVLFNVGLFRCVRRETRFGGVGLAVCAAGSAALVAPLGPSDVMDRRNGDAHAYRVALVQGNLSSAARGDPERAIEGLETLSRISSRVAQADLLVWPESAASFVMPLNARLLKRVMEPTGTRFRYHLVGSPVSAGANGGLHNSALLFGPDGEVVGRHDKVHLLPFAEYIPWPLPLLVGASSPTIAGSTPQPIDLDETWLGPLVCYEVIFSELSVAQVRAGAQILVNISNDAWFGTTGAVEQHFASAVYRAVETSRPVLRSTNTGITGAIDSSGRVVARLVPNQEGVLLVDVEPSRRTTLYVRTGEVVGPACLVLSILLATLARRPPAL